MLRLDRNEALRCLGYAGQSLDDELAGRFEEAVRACESLLTPRSVWRAFPLEKTRKEGAAAHPAEAHPVEVHSADAYPVEVPRDFMDCDAARCEGVWLVGVRDSLVGSDIAAHLQGAAEAVLMACTLGATYEREYQRRAAVSPTDGLLFGAAASALVEAAANDVEAQVARAAQERGLRANRRYSPGYGDFPLAMQKAVLEALDAPRSIGLTATADCVLVPTKSITAVMGTFEGAVSDAVRMSCESCALHGRCALAEQGRTCHGAVR